VLAVVVLAGCGSGDERPAPVRPKLPFEVAQRLADRSDNVAVALVAGDTCGALDEARRLQEDAIAAINGRRVPAAFQEQLSTTVNDLVSRIECIPQDEDEDRGRGKGKGKGKGKDGGDD
jgi:hypothetical protein